MSTPPLHRSVHPSAHDDIRAAAEEHHVSPDTVARVLAEAGLYAMPVALLLAVDAEADEEDTAADDRRLPAIQFSRDDAGGAVCRLR